MRSTDCSVVAETVLTLAVLLQAGLSPARAWEHLAGIGDEAAARVCAAVARGVPVAPAIAAVAPAPSAGSRFLRRTSSSADADGSSAWLDVSAAWGVATTVGAPLAESLRGIAASLRDAQEARDDIRVALAEPAGTARLMGWLPLVAVGLGVALGFDTIGMLVRQPIGVVCLAAGLALIAASRRWTRSLVRSARAAAGVPGLDADLLAIALSGGVSIDRARSLVADARGCETDAATLGILALSRSAGVPAVELLRASATLARHRARIDGRVRAARLSSRLLLPLGVCTLPAFLLLGVAPMLLSVFSTVPVDL